MTERMKIEKMEDVVAIALASPGSRFQLHNDAGASEDLVAKTNAALTEIFDWVERDPDGARAWLEARSSLQ